MREIQKKIAMFLLPITLSSFLVFFAPAPKAEAAGESAKCAIRSGISAGLGAIAGGGDLNQFIKSLSTTLIQAGLGVLTGGLGNIITKALGSGVVGNIFKGLLGGAGKPSGEDKDPITVKPECDKLDARLLLEEFNRAASQRLYDELNKNYKIANYLAYGRRLAYKVYVTKEVLKKEQEEKIIIRVNAARELGLEEEAAQTDLGPIYQRRAAAAAALPQLYDPLSPEYLNYNLNRLTNNLLETTPMGQKLLGVNKGAKVAAAAQASADKNISSGDGNKDLLKCSEVGPEHEEDCNVETPAADANALRNAQFTALANYQLNPPDWKQIAGRLVAQGITNFLHRKLLENRSGKFIDDVLY